MIKIILSLLLLTAFTLLAGQDSTKVKFVVTAPGLSDSSSVFITGSVPQLGNWNPSKVPLAKLNKSNWVREFYFIKGTKIAYKITLGSWANEALNKDGRVPGNSELSIERDTTITAEVLKWGKAGKPDALNGKITGTAEYIRGLKGKGIKQRDVVIWLPPSYSKDKNKRYPVLYMQDGQNLFDPATSSFGTDWQLDEAADTLIRNRSIKGLIIVGIYNTSDRNSEYRDNTRGKSYMNFVVHYLKPLIDKKYRTLPGRNNTSVGGSSLGGLVSFMLAWEYPNVFSGAACLSPAFDIEDIDYVKVVKTYKGKKKKIKFYIDCGTAALDKRLMPGTEEMVHALEAKGFKDGKDLFFFRAEGAEHNEAAWSKRNPLFLKFLFGRKNRN